MPALVLRALVNLRGAHCLLLNFGPSPVFPSLYILLPFSELRNAKEMFKANSKCFVVRWPLTVSSLLYQKQKSKHFGKNTF